MMSEWGVRDLHGLSHGLAFVFIFGLVHHFLGQGAPASCSVVGALRRAGRVVLVLQLLTHAFVDAFTLCDCILSPLVEATAR